MAAGDTEVAISLLLEMGNDVESTVAGFGDAAAIEEEGVAQWRPQYSEADYARDVTRLDSSDEEDNEDEYFSPARPPTYDVDEAISAVNNLNLNETPQHGRYVGDDDIRRPDVVKKMSLLGRSEAVGSWVNFEGNDTSLRDITASAEDASIDWLYPPQRELSFPGNISHAKTTAHRGKKWLLVNIQSHLEFDCHCLNRDTWVEENVRELIAANFLFWQRGHTTSDAMVIFFPTLLNLM